jgi:two-component system sensor histidine kinase YesM
VSWTGLQTSLGIIGLTISPGVAILPTHIAKYEGANGRPVISVLLPIFDKNTIDLIGALAIDISLQEIERSFESSSLGGSGTFFIISADSIVYHPNEKRHGLPMQQTGLAALKIPDKQMTLIQRYRGIDYLIGSSLSPATGWRIVSQVPFHEMAVGLSSARISMLC